MVEDEEAIEYGIAATETHQLKHERQVIVPEWDDAQVKDLQIWAIGEKARLDCAFNTCRASFHCLQAMHCWLICH